MFSHNGSGQIDSNLIKKIDDKRSLFIKAMDDDLNTADALSHIFDLVSIINTNVDEGSAKESIDYAYKTFMDLVNVLGLLYRNIEEVDDWIENLIEERQEARKNKDFQRADAIRDQLLEEGIELEDTRTGVVWKRRG